MREDATATYTFAEAVNIIINSSKEELEIIAGVLQEEKHKYCLVDLRSFKWIIESKREELKLK